MTKKETFISSYRDLKKSRPDALLLFRCGDFYEAYETDAEEAAKILGITLTHHADGYDMAGFPHHALDVYLPKLIRAGKRVAICDQLEDPKLTKQLVKRGDEPTTATASSNQNPTVMKQTIKAADLIGKTIVVGDNQATIVIKSVDGDKLSGEFSKDGKTTPMSFPISQLHGMTEKGLWKLQTSDVSPQTSEVATEADVQEVQDIVPVVTPRKPEPKSDEPKAKVQPIKPKKQAKPEAKAKSGQPKAKDEKPAEGGAKYTYKTYKTKKGKTGAKIYGFASEDDVFYAMAADIHASGSYERDKDGNKHYYLCFGPRYAEAAKSICEVLNSDKTVNQKVEECKLIVSQATEGLVKQREEWKQKAEERRARREERRSAPKPKTYTPDEVAALIQRIANKDPEAIKEYEAMLKAA